MEAFHRAKVESQEVDHASCITLGLVGVKAFVSLVGLGVTHWIVFGWRRRDGRFIIPEWFGKSPGLLGEGRDERQRRRGGRGREMRGEEEGREKKKVNGEDTEFHKTPTPTLSPGLLGRMLGDHRPKRKFHGQSVGW